jgi:hypothetical protein
MGAIAGDWEPARDAAYRFRFFFWTDSQRPLQIGQIAIELCRRDGADLLIEASAPLYIHDTPDDPLDPKRHHRQRM